MPKNAILKRCFCLFGIFLYFSVNAQPDWPVEISFINEGTAIPFTRLITTPIHPGIQAGTEMNLNEPANSRFFVALHIGYYYHKSFSQGIYLKPSIGYEYRHKSGVAISSRFGLGYLHTFSTQTEYKLVDGEYIKRHDAGNARIMPSLNLGLNYYLRPEDLHSPKIFIGYESWIEYPFSPGFIPAMTHVSSSLGVLFYPFNDQKKQ